MPTLLLFDCHIFSHILAPEFHNDFVPVHGPQVAVAILGERRGDLDELMGSVVAKIIFVAARILAVG